MLAVADKDDEHLVSALLDMLEQADNNAHELHCICDVLGFMTDREDVLAIATMVAPPSALTLPWDWHWSPCFQQWRLQLIDLLENHH